MVVFGLECPAKDCTSCNGIPLFAALDSSVCYFLTSRPSSAMASTILSSCSCPSSKILAIHAATLSISSIFIASTSCDMIRKSYHRKQSYSRSFTKWEYRKQVRQNKNNHRNQKFDIRRWYS